MITAKLYSHNNDNNVDEEYYLASTVPYARCRVRPRVHCDLAKLSGGKVHMIFVSKENRSIPARMVMDASTFRFPFR